MKELASPHVPEQQLASEQVIISAPMSFTGAAERAWRLTEVEGRRSWRIIVAALVIGVWWTGVLLWYATFGLLLVPYRLIRRGQRKRKMEAMRHRETLGAIEKK